MGGGRLQELVFCSVFDSCSLFFALKNSKIESLAEEHNFVLHENAFTPKCFPTSEQFNYYR